MFYLYLAMLPMKDPFHMHQTAHIGSGDDLCAMMEMIGNPVLPHLDRYGLFHHAKGSAKSTALVLPVQLDQLKPLYQAQQLLWF